MAKTALAVLAVASIGGFATLATFTFQQSRTREVEERDQRLERWRLDAENARDRRDRQDQFLRSLLTDTLTAYHRVKRVRRLIGAETTGPSGGFVTLAVYDNYISQLVDEQLEFEKFKRLAPFIADERINTEGHTILRNCYAKIERSLNKVIDEYKENRQKLVGTDRRCTLDALPRLSGFIGKEFVPDVSRQIDRICADLQAAVLQPLVLTNPDEP
ncbi:MAG: hypothetical protein WB565_14465 [Acidimicrobiales bacterium]